MGANILKGGDIPKVLRGNIPGGTTPDLFLHWVRMGTESKMTRK